MRNYLAIFILALAIPATAQASYGPQVPITPPLGVTVTAPDGSTMTTNKTDAWTQKSSISYTSEQMLTSGLLRTPIGSYQWGGSRPYSCTRISQYYAPSPGACVTVPGILVSWDFLRYHEFRTKEWYGEAALQRYYPATGEPVQIGPIADIMVSRPQYNNPACFEDFEHPGYVVPMSGGYHGMGASPKAPDGFVAECGLTRTPDKPAPATETATTKPQTAQSCAAVKVNRKRVAIKQVGGVCSAARSIMARFVKTGDDPDGYVCVKLAGKKQVVAKCKAAVSTQSVHRAKKAKLITGTYSR